MWKFEPDEDGRSVIGSHQVEIPYFEDARAEMTPYYSSEKSIKEAKQEVADTIALLGGIGITFQSGKFYINGQLRYGYVIRFQYRGVPSLLRIAGLPMRKETDRKRTQVRVQALLNMRDQLKAALRSPVFSPGLDPLMPMMLADTQNEITVMDAMRRYLEGGRFPQLPQSEKE